MPASTSAAYGALLVRNEEECDSGEVREAHRGGEESWIAPALPPIQ